MDMICLFISFVIVLKMWLKVSSIKIFLALFCGKAGRPRPYGVFYDVS